MVPHRQLFEASGKSGQGCTDKVRRKIVHKIRGIRKKIRSIRDSHPKPHALGLLVEEPLHGQTVAFQPEAADAAYAVAAQQALLAKIFVGVYK